MQTINLFSSNSSISRHPKTYVSQMDVHNTESLRQETSKGPNDAFFGTKKGQGKNTHVHTRVYINKVDLASAEDPTALIGDIIKQLKIRMIREVLPHKERYLSPMEIVQQYERDNNCELRLTSDELQAIGTAKSNIIRRRSKPKSDQSQSKSQQKPMKDDSPPYTEHPNKPGVYVSHYPDGSSINFRVVSSEHPRYPILEIVSDDE